MKNVTKVMLVLVAILFSLGAGNLSLSIEPVKKSAILDKSDTFPYSTELGGIHLGMSLKEAIKRLGEKYKGSYDKDSYNSMMGGEPSWCIAYNDPSGKASILIDSGAVDKNYDGKISAITLSVKPIPDAPEARVSFLDKGTAKGAKLGTTMEEVKRLYPSLDPRDYSSEVPTPPGTALCSVEFRFFDKKVVKIWIGFPRGC